MSPGCADKEIFVSFSSNNRFNNIRKHIPLDSKESFKAVLARLFSRASMKNESSSNRDSTLERLERINEQANRGGGQSRIDDQHRKGKKTARERIDLLLDSGSFVELDKFVLSRDEEDDPAKKHYGDGVVTGYGTIDGRIVFLFAHDFTIFGAPSAKCSARK